MMAKWVLALTAGVLWAFSASALPISCISATTVPTDFIPDIGIYGNGVLELDGTLPLIIHYQNGTQGVLKDSGFYMVSDLFSDNSVAGKVRAQFIGGNLSLTDSAGDVLLSGRVLSLNLTEVFSDIGMLSAVGSFRAENGSLLTDWGYPEGSVYQLVFQVQPRTLSDLSVPFTGTSNISLVPIPEPATLALLAIGAGGLILRRRCRR